MLWRISVIIAVALGLIFTNQSPTPTGSWSATGAMSVARSGHAAVLLPDGRVFVAGGIEKDQPETAELFDPLAGTWRTAAAMPALGAVRTAVIIGSGIVMVVGETESALYDPLTDSWTALGKRNVSYSFAAATPLNGGRAFIFGRGVSELQNLIEIYDPETRSSRALGFAFPSRVHPAVVPLDDDVLVIGAVQYIYDVRNNRLRVPRGRPNLRSAPITTPAAARLADGRVAVSFHVTTPAGDPTNVLEIFDPTTEQWQSAGNMDARFPLSATLLPTGDVHFLGSTQSVSAIPVRHSTSMVYRSAESSVIQFARPGIARMGHSATLLSDGRLLVAGGTLFIGARTSSAELFDPAGAVTVGKPIVEELIPTAAMVRSPSSPILIRGANFTADSRAVVGDAEAATTFIDPNTLIAVIPDRSLRSVGTVAVSVRNGGLDGDSSSALLFTVAERLPIVSTASAGWDSAGAIVAIRAESTPEIRGFQFTEGIASIVRTGNLLENGEPASLRFRMSPANSFGGLYSSVLVQTPAGSCWCTSSGAPLNMRLDAAPVTSFFETTPPRSIPGVDDVPVRVGYAVITAESGTALPAALLRFWMGRAEYTQYGPGTVTNAMSTPPRGAAPPLISISSIAIVNPGDTANQITFSLKNAGGVVAGQPLSVTLRPREHFARYIRELLPPTTLSAFSFGTFEVSGSNPFAMMGLEFELVTFPMTLNATGAVVPVPTRTLSAGAVRDTPRSGTVGGASAAIFPQFAIGARWATDIILQNRSGSAITGRVDLFAADGSPMPARMIGATKSTFTYWIPPRESLILTALTEQ